MAQCNGGINVNMSINGGNISENNGVMAYGVISVINGVMAQWR
jgi:hypothetical protein